jgi:hypothetical protein
MRPKFREHVQGPYHCKEYLVVTKWTLVIHWRGGRTHIRLSSSLEAEILLNVKVPFKYTRKIIPLSLVVGKLA